MKEKQEVLLVSQLPDGSLSVSAPESLTVELLEAIASAVLIAVIRRSASLLNVLYRLKTSEVVESLTTRPPIVIT